MNRNNVRQSQTAIQDEKPGNIAALQAAQPGSQHPNGGGWNIVAPAAPQADQLTWPPGFAGEIAKTIYNKSYLQIREVSIAATLGLLAGVCGRAFVTPTGKNLSLYIILVARSGIGKDAMHEGIRGMISLTNDIGGNNFLRGSNFASGPALHKELLKQPGFLYLQGEFGRILKRMSNPRDTPMHDLRGVMTDVFGKKCLEGKTYSSSEKSLPSVQRPALSFIGETTPGTFYEALTTDMMDDGFMSRFLVISHEGERPRSNKNRNDDLSLDFYNKWRAIVARAIPYQAIINMPPVIEVICRNEALEKLESFEETARIGVNATKDEAERQVWNRAHAKALQIASLLAVADNEVNPEIDLGHATWAITIVKRDIEAFRLRNESGDIGGDDHSKYPPAKPGALSFVSRSKRHVRSLRLLETPKGVSYTSCI